VKAITYSADRHVFAFSDLVSKQSHDSFEKIVSDCLIACFLLENDSVYILERKNNREFVTTDGKKILVDNLINRESDKNKKFDIFITLPFSKPDSSHEKYFVFCPKLSRGAHVVFVNLLRSLVIESSKKDQEQTLVDNLNAEQCEIAKPNSNDVGLSEEEKLIIKNFDSWRTKMRYEENISNRDHTKSLARIRKILDPDSINHEAAENLKIKNKDNPYWWLQRNIEEELYSWIFFCKEVSKERGVDYREIAFDESADDLTRTEFEAWFNRCKVSY
jgi:hypothetical protein